MSTQKQDRGDGDQGDYIAILNAQQCLNLVSVTSDRQLAISAMKLELPENFLYAALDNGFERAKQNYECFMHMARQDPEFYLKVFDSLANMTNESKNPQVLELLLRQKLLHLHVIVLMEENFGIKHAQQCYDATFLKHKDYKEKVKPMLKHVHQNLLNWISTLGPQYLCQFFNFVENKMSSGFAALDRWHSEFIQKIFSNVIWFEQSATKVHALLIDEKVDGSNLSMSLYEFQIFVTDTYLSLAEDMGENFESVMQSFERYAGALARDLLRVCRDSKCWDNGTRLAMCKEENNPPQLLDDEGNPLSFSLKSWLNWKLLDGMREIDSKSQSEVDSTGHMCFFIRFYGENMQEVLDWISELDTFHTNHFLNHKAGQKHVIVKLLTYIFEDANDTERAFERAGSKRNIGELDANASASKRMKPDDQNENV